MTILAFIVGMLLGATIALLTAALWAVVLVSKEDRAKVLQLEKENERCTPKTH